MRNPGRSTAGGRRSDGGSATAELAVALPALIVVLAMALWAVSLLAGQLRCVDAARSAARALARGDAESSAQAQARAQAPAGASVTVRSSGSTVQVTVSLVVRAPARLPLPATTLASRATADRESPVPGTPRSGG